MSTSTVSTDAADVRQLLQLGPHLLDVLELANPAALQAVLTDPATRYRFKQGLCDLVGVDPWSIPELSLYRHCLAALPLATLPDDGYIKANINLVYDPRRRLSLDERYDQMVALLANVGLKRTDLKLGPAPEGETDGWPKVLTVNPVGLAKRLGLRVILPNLNHDEQVAAAAWAYCQMVAPLMQHLPLKRPSVSDWLKNRLQSNNVLLEPTVGQRWQARSTQGKNRPLVVHQLPCNPAARFIHEGTVYSFSPDHVCRLTTPDVLIGDLVGFCCLAVTEPWIMKGIAAGTAIHIDISGCRVFEGRWSNSPRCGQRDDEACLYYRLAVSAYDYCGSLLFR